MLKIPVPVKLLSAAAVLVVALKISTVATNLMNSSSDIGVLAGVLLLVFTWGCASYFYLYLLRSEQ